MRAVDGVSFSVAPGETLGLVGESGSGKSTLCRSVAAAADEPTSGSVRFEGEELIGLSARGAARATQRAADDLPGPVRVAQPAPACRPRSSATRSPSTGAPRAPSSSAGSASCWSGSASRRSTGTATPTSSRRPAAADRDRPRAGARAEAGDRRRAGLGARRLDPGPDRQPARGPPARPRARPTCSSPTTSASSATSPTGSRSCSERQDRRDRGRRAVCANPQHPYTRALLEAIPIPDPKANRARREPGGWLAAVEREPLVEPEQLERGVDVWGACSTAKSRPPRRARRCALASEVAPCESR